MIFWSDFGSFENLKRMMNSEGERADGFSSWEGKEKKML
jgi:hypothetical protein